MTRIPVVMMLAALGACVHAMSHNERYTNGEIYMDEQRHIFVRSDYDPNIISELRPEDLSYQDFEELAPGCNPVNASGDMLSTEHTNANKTDRSLLKLLWMRGGTYALSRDTISVGDDGYTCMVSVLGDTQPGRRHPYLVYDRDRVAACRGLIEEPPSPTDGGRRHPP